jgi:hypothetical protein
VAALKAPRKGASAIRSPKAEIHSCTGKRGKRVNQKSCKISEYSLSKLS